MQHVIDLCLVVLLYLVLGSEDVTYFRLCVQVQRYV